MFLFHCTFVFVLPSFVLAVNIYRPDSTLRLDLIPTHAFYNLGFQIPPIPQCGASIHLGDWMMVASSEWGAGQVASNGKLDFPGASGRTGAWVAKRNDGNQWLQVTFDREMKVTRVSTQGRYDANQWIKSYTLEYTKDGISMIPYKENGVVKVQFYNYSITSTKFVSNLWIRKIIKY